MSIQTLYKEFSQIATIDQIDDMFLVHTESNYCLAFYIRKGQCIFINGKDVSSEVLHEMLGI